MGRLVASKIIDLGFFVTGTFLALIFDGIDRHGRKRLRVKA